MKNRSMALKEADFHVKIVRFVMDHQPPIVACEFVDFQAVDSTR